MSLFRCPKCHLPITDTEIQNGKCECGHPMAVNSATLSTQTKQQVGVENSPTMFNLILVAGICVFLAALSFGIWKLSEKYDAPPPDAPSLKTSVG